MKPRIYLDNSATTPLDPTVFEAMIPAFREIYGNASSIHTFGQEARTRVEDSRHAVARLLGAEAREVVFTSGGTESDNAALWGVFRSGYRTGNHIITTRVEHPAVLATCKALEAAGAEVTLLPVNAGGRVEVQALERVLSDRTILISVMHANNETGVIQPIEEISALARSRGILLHSDAVQSAGKIPVDVASLGVDLLSLSAHKIHGPKGIGALYLRKGTPFVPFMTGGSHERKRRAGTENVPGIVGFGAAAARALERLPEMETRIRKLRDRFENEVRRRIPGVHVNGTVECRLPNVTSLSFERVEGEAAVIALDLEGIAVSTGSACSSGSLEPSHVLIAMGLRPERVQGALRISLSRFNTDGELDRTVDSLVRIVERLRKFSNRVTA